jgi:hypothetical protein
MLILLNLEIKRDTIILDWFNKLFVFIILVFFIAGCAYQHKPSIITPTNNTVINVPKQALLHILTVNSKTQLNMNYLSSCNTLQWFKIIVDNHTLLMTCAMFDDQTELLIKEYK